MGLCCSKNKEPKTERPTAQPTDEPSGDFSKDLLNAQNAYRSKHGAPSMKLSTKLTKDAQKWADTIAKKNTLQHSNDRDGAGENLAWSSGGLGAQESATMWYDEIKDYNFNQPGFAGNTGHFTQVVWKSSTEFGGAYAKSSSGATFVVGRYFPAGNINTAEEFRKNVLPS